MWVYCNGFLLRLRTHMYIRKINDSMHIQYGGTRKWVLLVELSTGRRVSLNISYVGVHHCSPRKTYVGVHTYLHTCAIYKSSIKTSVGVLWGSWERRYRQTNKHTWRYFLWGFGRDRTRRQTSHRKGSRIRRRFFLEEEGGYDVSETSCIFCGILRRNNEQQRHHHFYYTVCTS